MRISIKYKVPFRSIKVADVVYSALLPDLLSLPKDCCGEVEIKDNYLLIKLECSNISKLRALNNSFIGVILMLLNVVGEIENE